MVKLVRSMATPEVMSVFQHSRLAESLKIRCAAVQGRHGNNVEEAMANERGTGVLQTLAGVIAENLSMHFAPKMLDMLRLIPRANWPLAQFSKMNLEKTGSSELHNVQVQIAQGVAYPRSSAVKMVEQWETVNDVLEPLRRYAALVLAFDPLYGQALYGLLAVVIRELMYSGSGVAPVVKPTEVRRLKIYIELIRFHYGGANLSASTVPRFLHYDRSIGEESQRNLDDLLRVEAKDAKDAEATRDKKKRDQLLDKAKACFAFNGSGGCSRGKSCAFGHVCSGCGKKDDHGFAKCPKAKTT